MKYNYKTKNTCSTEISFDIDDNQKVTNVNFTGGCNGNLKAISMLVEGAEAEQIIEKCSGILCGRRPTSCADQLTLALKEALEQADAAAC